tara:strand:+ start:4608 stop:4802 length:195 start_codon:yes stop_codon:yes gene_type:complete
MPTIADILKGKRNLSEKKNWLYGEIERQHSRKISLDKSGGKKFKKIEYRSWDYDLFEKYRKEEK